MAIPVIRIDRLSKRYWIGEPGRGVTHLREALTDGVRDPLRRLAGLAVSALPPKELWALREVSFEVRRGEVLGIVGVNGAGKSTLLRIVSRVTVPTAGRVAVRGRIGSLLDVGIGFHPDLTGRENTYLNGTILGMRRREIERRFDEIVAFAGVESFIDTPVKRYSAGMYMRLAFAVAAHLDTEIVVVDEVLAVGDAEFQRRCLGKMSDVARSGRTVLFVSHNMAAIQRLCTSAIRLHAGAVADAGDPRTVAGAYLSGSKRPAFTAATRTGRPQLLSAELRDKHGAPLPEPTSSDPFRIQLRYVLPEDAPGTRVSIGVLGADGTPVFASGALEAGAAVPGRAGEYDACVTVPGSVLLPGEFRLSVCIWNERGLLDLQEPALGFTVHPDAFSGGGWQHAWRGIVRVPCRWEIEASPETGTRVPGPGTGPRP